MGAKDTEKSFEERWIEDESYALEKKAGRKEVANWLEQHERHHCIYCGTDYAVFKDELQAQLKSWGL